jgi:tRNA(Ile)-lysidine synthase TilS/MesJ
MMEKNSDICREEIIYWSECPTNDIEEYEGENPMKNEFEPFVGQCFLSEEEAFIFYKNYANQHGFCIRKGRSITKNGKIVSRDLFCHREGRQPLKIVEPSKEKRNRKSLQCGCKTHLRITL